MNVAVAGRYLDDPAKLAGVGLAITLLNSVFIWPMTGMNCAVETLVSQAYGAGDLRLCGVLLNRGRVINTAILVPLLVGGLFADSLLAALGQDATVIVYAFEYILANLPGIYCQA